MFGTSSNLTMSNQNGVDKVVPVFLLLTCFDCFTSDNGHQKNIFGKDRPSDQSNIRVHNLLLF